jgi:hypothetical protein
MKTKFHAWGLGLFTVVLLSVVSTSQAADLFFTGSGPSSATNRSTVIVGAKPSGQAVLHYLNATSDLASATIKFYRTGTAVAITAASGSPTNVVGVSAADATAFTTTNQTLILRHLAKDPVNDTYERLTNLTPTGNTIKFTSTAATVAKGDLIYVCTQDGSGLFVGDASKEYSATAGIYAGVTGKPLLVELNATTAGKLMVTGRTYKE